MSALHEDPYWPRASSWLAGDHEPAAVRRLAVIGAPVRLGSITPGRCDLAPAAIRSALARFSTYDVQHRVDVRSIAARDYGDLPITHDTPELILNPVSNAVRAALAEADAVVLLGGDNSITRAGCHGLGRCGLITFDAHYDVRHLDRGLNNGNPVRALLEDGYEGRNIIQIGIQSFANSQVYANFARKAGIRLVTAEEAQKRGMESVVREALDVIHVDQVYVDIDLDVLDRAYAPATPGSRPGGLTPGQIRLAARVCGLHPKVKAIDLVEIDPEKDIADLTALTAASCLLSFASGLAER
ncbi:MAG TPA: agmatinase family protein [Bryobacteraceae bacterium]|nr:agmatinase family protein [Bryobacteraceae bacterium]